MLNHSICGAETHVIYEGGKETVYVVICENHFLKVVVQFQAVIAERLLVAVAGFTCDRIDQLLVEESEIFWRENCVGLLISAWEEATVSAEILFFPFKLQNHIEGIDITAAVDCQ
jgi:hypothetical protein